jgi:hypothetical protein
MKHVLVVSLALALSGCAAQTREQGAAPSNNSTFRSLLAHIGAQLDRWLAQRRR